MPQNSAAQQFPLVLINTGGTFNKRYNPISGELFVPDDERAITQILHSALPNLDLHTLGVSHKDSLDMTDADRRALTAVIQALPQTLATAPVIVIHGTDTMHLTAAHLAQAELNRLIILTGAMKPFEIDPVEAALHAGLALGFAAANPDAGIYIAMHGRVLPYSNIIKNRALGVFQAAH